MLVVERAKGPWRVARANEKLLARGSLPGAFGYDLAAHAFREARARGVGDLTLLAAALPASWMVNSRADSPVFQRWLGPAFAGAWQAALGALEGGHAGWLALTGDARTSVAEAVRALCVDGHGVAAVSKVLALLRPECVPLMDDAALWLALDGLRRPSSADTPSAGAALFVPMMDWFCAAVEASWGELCSLARDYPLAPLDAAQVLDRVWWFDSWGYRASHGGAPRATRWWWVGDGEREAVVPVPGPHPGLAVGSRVELAQVSDPAWVEAARAALAV